MGKWLLLILVFFCSQLTFAQYQSIFGQTSTKWNTSFGNLGWYSYDTVYVEKDTVVDQTIYKKLMMASFGMGAFEGALIREDTISGKGWYKRI